MQLGSAIVLTCLLVSVEVARLGSSFACGRLAEHAQPVAVLGGKGVSELVPGMIAATGRWDHVAGENTPPLLLPAANRVRIRCDRNAGFCYEFIALFWTKAERDTCPCLDTEENDYRIMSWADGMIRAVAEYPAVDLELVVSLRNETVERSWRETSTRGVPTSKPPVLITWSLR